MSSSPLSKPASSKSNVVSTPANAIAATKTSRQEDLVVRRGSCLCKKVQYEIRGEPRAFRVCHCVNCRKATGSAFMANVFFRTDRFIITHGEEKLCLYEDEETGSGFPIQRFFCGVCGSNVYMRPTGQGRDRVVVVQIGGVDEAEGVQAISGWVPDAELYEATKRQWVEILSEGHHKLLGKPGVGSKL